jgi:hypothetical protein
MLLLVGIGIALAFIMQNRAMLELRDENTSLRDQILRSSQRQPFDTSNSLAQASVPPSPSTEVLRLRGDVGVLRRQLQELQELTRGQSAGDRGEAFSGRPNRAQDLENVPHIDSYADDSQVEALSSNQVAALRSKIELRSEEILSGLKRSAEILNAVTNR